jgi:hypothetical protein
MLPPNTSAHEESFPKFMIQCAQRNALRNTISNKDLVTKVSKFQKDHIIDQGWSVEYERKCELAAHRVIVDQTSYFTSTMDAFEQTGTPDDLQRNLGEGLNSLWNSNGNFDENRALWHVEEFHSMLT